MKFIILSITAAAGLLFAAIVHPGGEHPLIQIAGPAGGPSVGIRQSIGSGGNQPTNHLDPTPRLSLFAILANPERLHGKEIEIEALVSYGHDQFVLAPDPFNMTYSTGASLVNLDVTRCSKREELRRHGNPAVCYLRGTIDAHDPGPAEYPPKACTFRASECQFVVPVATEK